MQLAPVVAELARRDRWAGLLRDCHPSQAEMVDVMREPFWSALMARRQGKTEGVLRGAVHRCLTEPDFRFAWGEDFSQAAWDDVLPVVAKLSARYGFGYQSNGQLHEIRFPRGGFIRCYGLRQERFASLIRGKEFNNWYIDEAQRLYDVDLVALINNVILHTLTDRRGGLGLGGTPGEVDMGLFYRVALRCGAVVDANEVGDEDEAALAREQQLAARFQMVVGRPFSNPANADAQREQLDAYREVNPDIEAEPWVQRELFGRWVCDRTGRIIDLVPERNFLYRGDWERASDDCYLLGMDYGHAPDPCAFAAAAFNLRRYPHLVYLEGEQEGELLDHEIAAKVAEYQRRYPNIHRVMDSGGGGSSTIHHLNAIHGADVAAAQKADKLAKIAALRSDVTLGKVKIYNVHSPDRPQDSAIARQWARLQWVRTKRGREEGKPRHIHDASLYAWRESGHHGYRPPRPEKTPKQRRMADIKRRERMARR